MKTPLRISLAALLGLSFMLTGCGQKMADKKFAAVATTIYEKIQDNWDHQPGERWVVYYERRIAEACASNSTSMGDWDKKIRDVQANPDEVGKILDKDILTEILKWESDRAAAKAQDS
jgi:hypothetical protein